MKTLKVHPAADLFPMMSEEELAELADDIKQNGLRFPIIVDGAQLLIDGRNRLEACKRAGVDPIFETLSGDPLPYIYSANVKRRHLSKGQQAMLTAMMFPDDGGKGGRGKKDQRTNPEETAGFSERRLKQARQILSHSPALAEDIIKGTVRFDDVLQQVQQQIEANESAEQAADRKRKEDLKSLASLRKTDPELAARVDDENISLKEALAIKQQLDREREQDIAAGQSAADNIALDLDTAVRTIAAAFEAGGTVSMSDEDKELFESAVGMWRTLLKEHKLDRASGGLA
jgi:hypothetical protein